MTSIEGLHAAVDELRAFCLARDVDLERISKLRQFEWIEALKDVTEPLMLSDDKTQSFLAKAGLVDKLFKAILPDPQANEFGGIRKAIRVIMDRIAQANGRPDVLGVMA